MKYLKRFCPVGLVVCLVLVLAGCASYPRAPKSKLSSYDPECFMDHETVQVPMSHDGTRQWRVNAEVDGVPGVFVVDTGADFTVITPQFAQRLAATDGASGDRLISRKFHGARVDFAKITRFQLGGAAYAGFYAPVINLDHINRAMHTEVAGILGNNLLNKTAYEADWNRDVLTLESRSSESPAGAIPISIRNNRVYLQVRINGRAAEFALDTGAYRSTLALPEVARLKIPAEKQSDIDAPRIDVNGAEHLKQTQAELDTFEVGPIRRANYQIITWEHNALGMDLLAPWVLKVDARRGWMALEMAHVQ